MKIDNTVTERGSIRELQLVTEGQAVSDGDGVKLVRLIGNKEINMLDPFLMLDVFSSDQPQDYIGGFPSHPHRGFETVTYMLAGAMRHKDCMGNEGVIGPNDVQWMTAGKGIVHSEMPEQKDGLLMGCQLWVNLPQDEKMCQPDYQELPAKEIAVETYDDGSQVRIIAGKTSSGIEGPIKKPRINAVYMDVSLSSGATFKQPVGEGDNSFIYVIEGEISVGTSAALLGQNQLGVLTLGNKVQVKALTSKARFLLLSGTPLNEPVVRAGPFVMNTKEEILQAFSDFQSNRF